MMEHALVRHLETGNAAAVGRYLSGESLPSHQLWGILRRNRLLITACTTALVVTTAYFTSRVTPKYEASASIRIESIEQDKSRPGDFDISGPSLPNELPTEFQVLQSRTLLEAAADSLGLQLELREPAGAPRASVFRAIKSSRTAPPGNYRLELQPGGSLTLQDRATGRRFGPVQPGRGFDLGGLKLELAPNATRYQVIDFEVHSFADAVDRLQKTLRVKRRSPEANILDVTYRGTDPSLVQLVPNVLTARFIMSRQSERHAQARSTAKFLTEQIAKLSDRLRTAENDLRTFRERRGVVSLADEATTGLSRAGELQAKRNSIEAERTALADLVHGVRDSIKKNPSGGVLAYRNLVAFPSLLQNEALSRLLSSLTEVEDRRSELLSRRTLNDPDVQLLTARSRQLGEELGSMALFYLQGLTSEEAALDSVLGRSRQQLDQIPAKELQFARLQREARGLEEIVTQLQSRLKEAEIAEAVEDPSVRLVDAAVLPREPVSPKPLLNLSLAVVLGLVLGTSGSLLREYLDKTVRSRQDILLATGVPVLGLLPRTRAPAWWRTALRPRSAAHGPGGNGQRAEVRRSGRPPRGSAGLIRSDSAVTVVEAYNLLDTNLSFARPDESTKVLTVTSPLPGEGKTTVAVNLALTLARRGARVLLVDADLRCGIVGTLFGLAQEPGLSDVLLENVQFDKVAHAIPISETTRLHLLSRGKAFRNPAQLLGSPQARGLLASVRKAYDSVIIDTPPANVVADAAVMGAHSDGVIIVARAAVTEMEALAFAMDQLDHVHARVVGAVLNDIDFCRDSVYDKAYRYYARRDAYAQYAG